MKYPANILSAIVFLCLIGIAQSAGTGGDRKTQEVVRFWEEWRDARVRGDLDAMRQMMAPDFTSTHSDAKVLSREEYVQIWNPKKRKLQAIDLSDMKVRFYGDTAIVVLKATVRNPEEGPDRALPPLQVTSTIVKSNGRWQAVAMHVSRVPDK